jgi:uracil-DNA glycosylase
VSRLAGPVADQLAAVQPDWQPVLQAWARSDAGRATLAAVDARVAAGAVIYPAQVFRAFELTARADVRVLILGQDPYHGAGQAEGLAFSVAPGVPLPPSLRNMAAELQRDLGLPAPRSGSLVPWARQGVLLLNTTLTVEDGRAASHAKLGWQALTEAIIQALVEDAAPKVFMLWGAHAQAQLPRERRRPAHRVLEANHPSPLSARRPPVPFLGCGHFSAANAFLAGAWRGGIDWRLG